MASRPPAAEEPLPPVLAELPTVRVEAGSLLQHLSRVIYRGQPLHFGRAGIHRWDAPKRDYGVLYLGEDLPTVLMESLFHAHRWNQVARRSVALAEVRRRVVFAIGVLAPLQLADLTAQGVMAARLGMNLEQLASRSYNLTQRLSAQVHALHTRAGEPLFDGLLYPSRNNYPARCVALFERAADRVQVFAEIDLPDHADWPRFVSQYLIAVEPDLPRHQR